MAQAFRLLRDGRISGVLEAGERALLLLFLKDTIVLLEPAQAAEDPLVAITGMDMAVTRPEDSALLRLLPDAVADDPEAALEFRRLTERSLRLMKLERLHKAAEILESPAGEGAIVLEIGQARSFSQAINDIRLVMSAQLEINSDADAERITEYVGVGSKSGRLRGEPKDYSAVVYGFVSWLQESLVQALLEGLEHDPRYQRQVDENPDNFGF